MTWPQPPLGKQEALRTDDASGASDRGAASEYTYMTASCSEVEFLLIDPDTMLFGLDNRVFTAKRAK